MYFKYGLTTIFQKYVEAIYWISNLKKVARVRDIAERLEVGKSSVTGALQTLATKELVNFAPYEVITLAEEGAAVARSLVRRHEVMCDFFVRVLSIDLEEADAAADAMEHVVTDTILDRLIAFIEFVERCPRSGTAWIKDFGFHCDNETCLSDCETCLNQSAHQQDEDQVDRPSRQWTSLSQYGEADRLVLIEIDDDSSVKDRFRQTGAQLDAVIEIERIDSNHQTIQIRLKGYYEQLPLEDTEKILVLPIQGHNTMDVPSNLAAKSANEETVNESM